MEKLTAFLLITASILVINNTYSQEKDLFSRTLPIIDTINNNSKFFNNISSNIIENDFFYYDSLKIDHKGQGNHLSIVLFSTSASMEDTGELYPWYNVEAMEISLENLREVKITASEIDLIMKREWKQPGEENSYKVSFKINEEADLYNISRSFNLLVELLKKHQTNH